MMSKWTAVRISFRNLRRVAANLMISKCIILYTHCLYRHQQYSFCLKFTLIFIELLYIRDVEKQLQFLSIGHVCHDQVDDGYILGGTASYASLVAKQFYYQSNILTSFGDDFLFSSEFLNHGIDVYQLPSQSTTVFENIYTPNGRQQYLHQRASAITAADIKAEHLNADIVLLCPIDDEVRLDILDLFPQALKGASIQGWLRQWDKTGKISPKEMDWSLLSGLDIVIMSEEDIGYSTTVLHNITDAVSHVVLTDGMHGARVYKDNAVHLYPAFPVKEVEATGAGDVFTTAYLHEFNLTQDIHSSCIFAHCAASFIVEGIGIRNLPTIKKIMQRVDQYRQDT